MLMCPTPCLGGACVWFTKEGCKKVFGAPFTAMSVMVFGELNPIEPLVGKN